MGTFNRQDSLPILTRLFGHRRSWALFTQMLILVCIWKLAKLNPAEHFYLAMALSLTVAFSSATRDLATDAYRVESLNAELLGAGSALYILGYRIGMLASGAGALYVADTMDWFTSFQTMAACVIVGLITLLLVTEPKIDQNDESTEQENQTQKYLSKFKKHTRFTRILARLHAAIVCPFKELMKRDNWVAIIALVFFFKLGDNLVHFMANLFFLDLGFTKTEIAAVSKVFGLVAAIVGGFLGGAAMNKYGTIRTLLVFGAIHTISHFLYVAMAGIGNNLAFLYVTVAITNVTGGMCTAAFVAYLTSLCNKSYSMTQYALFSSLWSLSNVAASTSGGWIADQTNWQIYFSIATIASCPGLLLLLFTHRRHKLASLT